MESWEGCVLFAGGHAAAAGDERRVPAGGTSAGRSAAVPSGRALLHWLCFSRWPATVAVLQDSVSFHLYYTR